MPTKEETAQDVALAVSVTPDWVARIDYVGARLDPARSRPIRSRAIRKLIELGYAAFLEQEAQQETTPPPPVLNGHVQPSNGRSVADIDDPSKGDPSCQ